MDLNLSAPGEQLLTKVLDYLIRFRETMDPDIRKEWDQIILNDYKAIRAGLGRLGDKIENLKEKIDDRREP